MSHDETDTVPLTKVQGQVIEMKEVMQDNIKKAIDRSENLNEVQEKAENLSSVAGEFSTAAVHLKKKLMWQNLRLLAILLIIIMLVVAAVIIVIVAVSLTAQKK